MANVSNHFDNATERLAALAKELESIRKEIQAQKKVAIQELPDVWTESKMDYKSYELQGEYSTLADQVSSIRQAAGDIWYDMNWNSSSMDC